MFLLQTLNTLLRSDKNTWILEGTGEFDYSEGDDAEQYLRDCFSTVKDLSSTSAELQEKIRDWSSEYHLSPDRANLLRGLDLSSMHHVLELGCGCGSITRYLGEQGMTVEAVEGSGTRAELAAMRCRDLEQVHIVNANFNDLQLPEKQYDAIFLIGVLEYAALFSGTEQDGFPAAVAILSQLKNSLKENGILIIALENRLGLKYWMGATEDHYIEQDIGLLGYPGRKGVETFDLREWQKLIQQLDITSSRFVFPFPDYKLPRVLLSKTFVDQDPYAVSLLYRIASRDPCSTWQPADDEFLRWRGLHQSGYLADFANSFLIALSWDQKGLDALIPFDFVHFSSSARKSELRTCTVKPRGKKLVSKTFFSVDDGTEKEEEKKWLQVYTGEEAVYVSGDLLSTSWLEACCRKDGGLEFFQLLADYFHFLHSPRGTLLREKGCIDLLPFNIIVAACPVSGKDPEQRGAYVSWVVIDQEWQVDMPVTPEFLLFRALYWFVHHHRGIVNRIVGGHGLNTIGDVVVWCCSRQSISLDTRLDEYLDLEGQLHANIVQGGSGGFDPRVIWQSNMQQEEVDETLPDTAGEKSSMMSGSALAGALGEKMIPGVKRLLKSGKYLLLAIQYFFAPSTQYKIIRSSGLFDSTFYIQHDAILQSHFLVPLIHYCEAGWREGRNPNGLFESSWYRENNPDALAVDPLLHYIESGWRADLNPTPLFWTAWYGKQYPESIKNGMSPLRHYLEIGWQTGKKPNPYFDSAAYLENNPAVEASGLNPLVHCLHDGVVENVEYLQFFDASYYREDNPSSVHLEMSPFLHYLCYGAKEGREPCRFFDSIFYQQLSGVNAQAAYEPFLHYTILGCRENLRPNRLFDPVFYASTYPEYAEHFAYPLLHYRAQGVFRGHYPCSEVAELAEKPLISVITPVYNTDKQLLVRCIHSVLFQAYPHWQLCLVDDGSSEEHIREILVKYAAMDSRITVEFCPRNQGISAASNRGIERAEGEYLAFLDHDDELTLDALFEMVKAINKNEPDILYSDEDLVNLESRYQHGFYKPDFNSELLLSHNYITHFLVIRRTLFDQVGPFSAQFDGAQDYDLLLKMTEHTHKIYHVPRILYHWRAHENSTSVNHDQKEYADHAGRQALIAALARRGLNASVEQGMMKYYYQAKRRLPDLPTVALFVEVSGGLQEIRAWLKTMSPFLRYDALEINILVDEQFSEIDEQNVVHAERRCKILRSAKAVESAELYNHAVQESECEHLLFIDRYIRPLSGEWLVTLLEYSQEPGTGAVGGWIERKGEHRVSGVPDIDDTAWWYYRDFFTDGSCHMNSIFCAQNVLAVSMDLCMVKRDTFMSVQGFDSRRFPAQMYGIDFCLRMSDSGKKNVYTPYCKVIRQELYTQSLSDEPKSFEIMEFKKKWNHLLAAGNPYYNTNRLFKETDIAPVAWHQWFVEP